ncbi:MAG: hypothetical protein ACI4O3_02495 [Oscillospiraceae bacterium]
MAINKYGIKMTGLKKASGNTVNWSLHSGGYTEIFYDRSTGEIWTKDQISIGQNSWTVYHDPDVIKICNTSRHMTMQQLSDAVRDKLAEIEYMSA